MWLRIYRHLSWSFWMIVSLRVYYFCRCAATSHYVLSVCKRSNHSFVKVKDWKWEGRFYWDSEEYEINQCIGQFFNANNKFRLSLKLENSVFYAHMQAYLRFEIIYLFYIVFFSIYGAICFLNFSQTTQGFIPDL